nr:hypothetical protein [Tanacetum cinerariifolium]
ARVCHGIESHRESDLTIAHRMGCGIFIRGAHLNRAVGNFIVKSRASARCVPLSCFAAGGEPGAPYNAAIASSDGSRWIVL